MNHNPTTPSLPCEPVITVESITLTRCELDIIIALRQAHVLDTLHPRMVVISWNGRKPTVFDCEQIN